MANPLVKVIERGASILRPENAPRSATTVILSGAGRVLCDLRSRMTCVCSCSSSHSGGSESSSLRAFSSSSRVSAACFFNPSTTCAGALARKLGLPNWRSALARPFSYFAMSFVNVRALRPRRWCAREPHRELQRKADFGANLNRSRWILHFQRQFNSG